MPGGNPETDLAVKTGRRKTDLTGGRTEEARGYKNEFCVSKKCVFTNLHMADFLNPWYTFTIRVLMEQTETDKLFLNRRFQPAVLPERP